MNSALDDQNCSLLRENMKLKEQIEIKNRELDKLEHVLLANLAHKEQEIADLSAQIEDMKASSNPCNQQLRCMGLDPAVNAVFIRIKKDMKAANEKLEQTQNDLQAWKFTPDSQTGKRMMTRMRVLLQENEELGKINQSGRTAKLESEIAMKRTLIEELKQTNSEYENVIDEMDTETDCFQTSIFMLQQQLGIARKTITALCTETEKLSPGRGQQILTECNWIDNGMCNKEEPMEVDPAGDQDHNSNSSNCQINHSIGTISSSDSKTITSKKEHNCNSDDRTSKVKKSTAAITHTDPHATDRRNISAMDNVELKSESIDSSSSGPIDGHKDVVVTKKHSVKSNSAFNQKKKLTS